MDQGARSACNRPSITAHAAIASPQFFRVGKPAAYAANEPYQPDTRLRVGLGVKALSPKDDIFLRRALVAAAVQPPLHAS